MSSKIIIDSPYKLSFIQELPDGQMKIRSTYLQLELLLFHGDNTTINCTVPFPVGYPMTPFRNELENKNIANLSITYNKSKNTLHILHIYVYSSYAKYKDSVTNGEKLKGFGKYMLCQTTYYMMEIVPECTRDTIVTLTAQGNQCYDRTPYKDFTIEDYRRVIPSEKLLTTFIYKLLKHPNLPPFMKKIHTIYNYYDTDHAYKKVIDNYIMDIIMKDYIVNPESTLLSLQTILCKIDANQQLIERNYKKIYGFEVVSNYGDSAEMKGTVANIIQACRGIKGIEQFGKRMKKSRMKKSRMKNRRNSNTKCK